MCLEVGQDGTVHLAFAQRKIVDAEVAGPWSWGRRLLPGEAKERIGTDCHTLGVGQDEHRIRRRHQGQDDVVRARGVSYGGQSAW
jgi:hypothetical protein